MITASLINSLEQVSLLETPYAHICGEVAQLPMAPLNEHTRVLEDGRIHLDDQGESRCAARLLPQVAKIVRQHKSTRIKIGDRTKKYTRFPSETNVIPRMNIAILITLAWRCATISRPWESPGSCFLLP